MPRLAHEANWFLARWQMHYPTAMPFRDVAVG